MSEKSLDRDGFWVYCQFQPFNTTEADMVEAFAACGIQITEDQISFREYQSGKSCMISIPRAEVASLIAWAVNAARKEQGKDEMCIVHVAGRNEKGRPDHIAPLHR